MYGGAESEVDLMDQEAVSPFETIRRVDTQVPLIQRSPGVAVARQFEEANKMYRVLPGLRREDEVAPPPYASGGV